MRKILPSVKVISLMVVLMPLIAFMFFQPSVRASWDSNYRKNLLVDFITDVKSSGKINPQKYWYFRERYSPGSFTFNKNAIDLLQTFRIIDLDVDKRTDLLFYDSRYLDSTDSVLPASQSAEFKTQVIAQNQSEVILESDNFVLHKPNDKTVELVFILPIEEMKRANGFFDYLESENQLLEDKVWFNKTIFYLD